VKIKLGGVHGIKTRKDHLFRVCLGLSLTSRAFKSKRVFGQKFHFKAFAKSVFWLFLGFLNI
jgi:hypothetical protein